MGGEDMGVVCEPLWTVGVEPSALLLQCLGVVEVEDGGERSNLCREKAIDEAVVVGERFPIRLSGPLRQDARPAEGEAVGVEPHLAHVADVLGVAMVLVGGDKVGTSVFDGSGSGLEGLKDGAATAVSVERALDLNGGGRGSPEEASRECVCVGGLSEGGGDRQGG